MELEEMEEKIQQRGFLDGLVLRMRRDSSKQSELEQGLQAAADEKFQGACVCVWLGVIVCAWVMDDSMHSGTVIVR